MRQTTRIPSPHQRWGSGLFRSLSQDTRIRGAGRQLRLVENPDSTNLLGVISPKAGSNSLSPRKKQPKNPALGAGAVVEPTDYDYDVFVSYRRHGLWLPWVQSNFEPLFRHWLGEELGRPARVFIDYITPAGNTWPLGLAKALATSKSMVCLLSRTYFSSTWCVTEFGQMRAREEKLGLRVPARPDGLIVPATLHDGDSFPSEVRVIQQAQLQAYANTRMAPNSPRAEELERAIRAWVPDVAAAIGRAPVFDPTWIGMAARRFIAAVETPSPTQLTVPFLAPS